LFEGWWVGMNLGVEYIRFNLVQSFREGFFKIEMHREKSGLFSIGQKPPRKKVGPTDFFIQQLTYITLYRCPDFDFPPLVF